MSVSGTGQIAVICVCIGNLGLILLANALMIWNRKYAAVRSKNLPFTTLANFGSTCGALGMMVHSGVFGFRDVEDKVWIIVGVMMGGGVVLTSFVGHSFQLYTIFKAQKKPKYSFLTYFALLYIPVVVACLVNVGLSDTFSSLHFIWGIIYVCAFWVLAFRMRHIRKEFNDFVIMCIGAAVLIIAFLIAGVSCLFSECDLNSPYEYYQSLAYVVLIMYFFWARCAKIVFKLVTRDKSYLSQWSDKFNQRSVAEVMEQTLTPKHANQNQTTQQPNWRPPPISHPSDPSLTSSSQQQIVQQSPTNRVTATPSGRPPTPISRPKSQINVSTPSNSNTHQKYNLFSPSVRWVESYPATPINSVGVTVCQTPPNDSPLSNSVSVPIPPPAPSAPEKTSAESSVFSAPLSSVSEFVNFDSMVEIDLGANTYHESDPEILLSSTPQTGSLIELCEREQDQPRLRTRDLSYLPTSTTFNLSISVAGDMSMSEIPISPMSHHSTPRSCSSARKSLGAFQDVAEEP